MNKIIEKELKKTLVADLSNFNKTTNTYYIPRYKQLKLDVGKCYIIQLDNYLLDATKSNLLAVNFNKNSVPTEEYMKVEVCKTMGKMVYIDGVGYNINDHVDLPVFWSGWLTLDHLTVIEELV